MHTITLLDQDSAYRRYTEKNAGPMKSCNDTPKTETDQAHSRKDLPIGSFAVNIHTQIQMLRENYSNLRARGHHIQAPPETAIVSTKASSCWSTCQICHSPSVGLPSEGYGDQPYYVVPMHKYSPNCNQQQHNAHTFAGRIVLNSQDLQQ